VAAVTEHAVTYVGPPELHDGHVVSVERAGDRATVRVRGADGTPIALEFTGVTTVTAVRPEGMLLYGLAELRGPGAGRQFVFANWEEWDNAGLEIAAREFRVLPPATPVHPDPAA
jgi:hypothetical protein